LDKTFFGGGVEEMNSETRLWLFKGVSELERLLREQRAKESACSSSCSLNGLVTTADSLYKPHRK